MNCQGRVRLKLHPAIFLMDEAGEAGRSVGRGRGPVALVKRCEGGRAWG